MERLPFQDIEYFFVFQVNNLGVGNIIPVIQQKKLRLRDITQGHTSGDQIQTQLSLTPKLRLLLVPTR